MAGRDYLQHARRHLPGGTDPLPFLLEAPATVMPWVVFATGGIGLFQAPADTPTTWDWTGGTLATNDIDGGLSTPGDTWTGNTFSVDFGSDPSTINIGSTGVFLLYAFYWISVFPQDGAPFWVKLFMDGTDFAYIDPPADHETTYVNPATEFDGGNTYGKYFRLLVSPSTTMTRQLVVTHNTPDGQFDAATLAIVKLSNITT